MLWGILDAVSVVVHHDTLWEIKWPIVTPDSHWLLPSPPDIFQVGLILWALPLQRSLCWWGSNDVNWNSYSQKLLLTLAACILLCSALFVHNRNSLRKFCPWSNFGKRSLGTSSLHFNFRLTFEKTLMLTEKETSSRRRVEGNSINWDMHWPNIFKCSKYQNHQLKT